MNTNFRLYAFITLFLTAFAFADTTYAVAQKPRDERDSFMETNRRGMMPGVVSAANRLTFQIGKDFACAIDDSKLMKDDDESFNYTIVDLVYLIDELEGQAEAAQLQAILKGVVRGTKDLTAISGEVAVISNTFLTRQAAEQKWYFNVGSSQMNLMIAGWSKDAVAANKNMKDLQNLSKTSPLGTPPLMLEAIKGLSKYAAMTPMTVNDFSDLVADTKLITTLMYA
jgi:hypothetical protein